MDQRFEDITKTVVAPAIRSLTAIPWSDIDMDFMNLNQSAHGDREFGFMVSRMRMNRKVVVGHWQDAEVLESINAWSRAPRAGTTGRVQKLYALAIICAMWR